MRIRFNILYLHAPEKSMLFEKAVEAIDDLYKEGLFKRGMYNPIARSATTELLPCIKHYNMGFYAYNPISRGVLTRKYKFVGHEVKKGHRYDPNTQTYYEAVQAPTMTASASNLALLEATLRWMRHHSGQTAKDGIIIGSWSVAQLEGSLTGLDKGPLSVEMFN
ncbi:hypothetical protein BG015_002622 [Linnemannia schmuckeri]|uniref:NADP-dependent oxidoreductase domain-containing protein n=1 Tax=Linnemannia schmuckeri TaxID=64567 RepID=A0A9P5RR02_9FUNG|nr:hypothetical protein BG015_002622 [Linnemannia schmuckeri]